VARLEKFYYNQYSLRLCSFILSAFVVRLITKRFIGEYDQNKGKLMHFHVLTNSTALRCVCIYAALHCAALRVATQHSAACVELVAAALRCALLYGEILREQCRT